MTQLRYMSGRELDTRRTAREAQLAWIKEQVARGELVIRQATAEERERFGIGVPRPRASRRRRGAADASSTPSRASYEPAGKRSSARTASLS
jgi:hypothetical protein